MKIDDKCVGCAQCATFCPNGAIKVCGRAIMTEVCTGCRACVRFCPVGAIGI